MSSTPFVQFNTYKGISPRPWLHVRLKAADGSLHEREMVADTGSPCSIILGRAEMALLLRGSAPGISSNFGYLNGGIGQILGYASDTVLQAVQADSHDFAGLIGLPLLRRMEYGGDDSAFWVRTLGAHVVP